MFYTISLFIFLATSLLAFFIGKILPQTELNFDQKGQKTACTDLENISFGKNREKHPEFKR
jgi:hypothetical protein